MRYGRLLHFFCCGIHQIRPQTGDRNAGGREDFAGKREECFRECRESSRLHSGNVARPGGPAEAIDSAARAQSAARRGHPQCRRGRTRFWTRILEIVRHGFQSAVAPDYGRIFCHLRGVFCAKCMAAPRGLAVRTQSSLFRYLFYRGVAVHLLFDYGICAGKPLVQLENYARSRESGEFV